MRGGQIEHFLEGRDQVEPVKFGRTAGADLACAQGADLGEGEIIDPPIIPPALDAASVGEFGVVGDIGTVGEIAVMTHHENTIGGQHEVGLDNVGALLDRQPVGLDRVFGQFAIGTAMRDHQGGFTGKGLPDIGVFNRRLGTTHQPGQRCRGPDGCSPDGIPHSPLPFMVTTH